jgi:hypothetical protein
MRVPLTPRPPPACTPFPPPPHPRFLLTTPQAASKAAAAAAAGLELDSPEGFYALLSQPLETAASNEIDLDDDDETGEGGGRRLYAFLVRGEGWR